MNASELQQLNELIHEKRWQAFDKIIRGKTESVSEILIKFLDRMSQDQRKLTMQILSDYLIISDYREPAINLLEKICEHTTRTLKIAPVVMKGASRVKSGAALIYDMDARQTAIEGREFTFFDTPIESEFCNGEGDRVLVDDFVGTGEQVIALLDAMSKIKGNHKVDYLATLVIQEEGKEKIEKYGIKVITLETRPKALERLAEKTGQDIAKLREVYLGIESNTGCSTFESLGYRGSEAAVTMKKTPDNTLPIFWYEGEGGWPAPFPRRNK